MIGNGIGLLTMGGGDGTGGAATAAIDDVVVVFACALPLLVIGATGSDPFCEDTRRSDCLSTIGLPSSAAVLGKLTCLDLGSVWRCRRKALPHGG